MQPMKKGPEGCPATEPKLRHTVSTAHFTAMYVGLMSNAGLHDELKHVCKDSSRMARPAILGPVKLSAKARSLLPEQNPICPRAVDVPSGPKFQISWDDSQSKPSSQDFSKGSSTRQWLLQKLTPEKIVCSSCRWQSLSSITSAVQGQVGIWC